MNTKNCPKCGQINQAQQAFCYSCGRQFVSTAPTNTSEQPNFQTQVNFNQPNPAQQPNYNQPNYNQPNYNQPNYNQPNNFQQPFNQPKKSSATLWWLLGGGTFAVILFGGIIFLFGIGIFIGYANSNTSIEGKWEDSRNKSIDFFGGNNRLSETKTSGTVTYADYSVEGSNIRMKLDTIPVWISGTYSISGNTLTITFDGKPPTTFRRIE